MPKKPEIAIIDLDFLIYSASSISEKITYTYYDKNGKEVASFDSAQEGKRWLEMIEAFGGYDTEFGYEGDLSDLRRETSYKPQGLGKAQKNFDRMLKEWLVEVDVDRWQGYCSALKGMKLFRHDIATIQSYKGNRKGSHKPHYLDDVRRYALSYSNVKRVGGGIECDDKVCEIAQSLGEKAVLVCHDKDGYTTVGNWIWMPNEEMVFSDPSKVGEVYLDKTNKSPKVKGYGNLFLLSQCLTGDKADHYAGCPSVGNVGAVNTLSPFNGKPITSLKSAVQATGEVFRDKVGDYMEYEHCRTGEIVRASWKEVFIENLLLAYMVKGKGDKPFEILKYIEEM